MRKIPIANHAALGFLTAVVAVNHIDRFLLPIMIEPIKHELRISDTKVGLLTGAAVSFFSVSRTLEAGPDEAQSDSRSEADALA
jgi:hypothetical protein